MFVLQPFAIFFSKTSPRSLPSSAVLSKLTGLQQQKSVDKLIVDPLGSILRNGKELALEATSLLREQENKTTASNLRLQLLREAPINQKRKKK